MEKKGVFLISIDFELHWGCIESRPLLNHIDQNYFNNTRKAIPEILNLFKNSSIHATWATVGMLFNRDIGEWEANKPSEIPEYEDDRVSTYDWVAKNNFYSESDPYHFANDLIQMIIQTPFQEIGTHTYSHYFCLEKGQTISAFRKDIEMAKKIGLQNGIEVQSLVFPRNQYNESYLMACREMGITAVRTNPNNWYWRPVAKSSAIRKICRTLDAYTKLSFSNPVYLKEVKNTLPIQLPASRLYRPWTSQSSILNKLKLKRILHEMTVAAKSGACYHIWWHPHNFGNHPSECLQELETIINHYTFLNKKYGFFSATMLEAAELVLKLNKERRN